MNTDNELSQLQPTDEMRREAMRNPNGWVYAIRGDFAGKDAIPPEAIRGAWRVDDRGEIVAGSFMPNPRFQES